MIQGSPGPSMDGKEHRRSLRFEIVVPIEVSWAAATGAKVIEPAEVVEASQHGGLLAMHKYPPLGIEIEVTNNLSGEKAAARSVAIRHSKEANLNGLAIELVEPSEKFWGITYRLRRASAELKALEEEMKSGSGLDLRVLQEFRDAVDYVRKTAWVVYEFQERQMQHRDTATVMPLLTSERLRRATQLCDAILTDLSTLRPERYPGEVSAFFEVVTRIHGRLDPIVGPNRPRVD